jgi:hypothetical protein
VKSSHLPLLLAALAACACDPAPPPSGSAQGSRTVPAPAPAPTDAADGRLLGRKLPRIEYRGGPFLRNPKIVTITFTNDDPKWVTRLEQFGAVITRSAWWREVTAGYCAKPGHCIGNGSASAPVQLDEVLPTELRDTDIDALLLRMAKIGRLGAIDDNTLLLVYLPAGVTLADATTRYCAGRARALHRSLEIDSARIPFAILPRCGDEAELTGSASHEILEATTNPFPAERGFAFVMGSAQSGFTAAGVEPVDPCGLITMDGHWTTDSGFVMHRAWSNAAAAQAHDPCVPSRADLPYVMLVPREPAVRLAHEGETVTIELDASTAGAAKTWAVSAFDLSGYQDHAQYVDVSLDKSTITSGESVRLTIASRKTNPSQRQIVALVSTLGVHSYMWPLLVMMR